MTMVEKSIKSSSGVGSFDKKSFRSKKKRSKTVDSNSSSRVSNNLNDSFLSRFLWSGIFLVALLLFYNQFLINDISSFISPGGSAFGGAPYLRSGDIDINSIKSTAQTIAAVFPVDEFETEEDVFAAMFPTGTPEYGEALGVSFDDPVGSLEKLAKMYRPLKAEVEKNNPEAFQRFVNLASRPLGVSCEYCCGVGPVGADKNGNSRCGCQHNPALLSVALWLSANTDYSDAQILYEVMRWKTLFFPKNMISLGTKLAGGDTSLLKDVPGMVGGC